MRVTVSGSFLDHPITLAAEQVGNDWRVSLSGGQSPHIGAVSLAWPEGDTIQARSLVRPSHKDHIVGEHLAVLVARATGRAVCVESGIHYDDLTKAEIGQIVELTHALSAELTEKLIQNRG